MTLNLSSRFQIPPLISRTCSLSKQRRLLYLQIVLSSFWSISPFLAIVALVSPINLADHTEVRIPALIYHQSDSLLSWEFELNMTAFLVTILTYITPEDLENQRPLASPLFSDKPYCSSEHSYLNYLHF
ncbi:hypothetical protein L6452_03058 [Arctium lappa]|uniref:Uncharacterized protein n=1 Tax=Arctium lappa TaxID=4217 RepID=A0ACB9FL44_ARCLA|nr:hypothetical protein L6452_03058 [Arctium lappa]